MLSWTFPMTLTILTTLSFFHWKVIRESLLLAATHCSVTLVPFKATWDSGSLMKIGLGMSSTIKQKLLWTHELEMRNLHDKCLLSKPFYQVFLKSLFSLITLKLFHDKYHFYKIMAQFQFQWATDFSFSNIWWYSKPQGLGKKSQISGHLSTRWANNYLHINEIYVLRTSYIIHSFFIAQISAYSISKYTYCMWSLQDWFQIYSCPWATLGGHTEHPLFVESLPQPAKWATKLTDSHTASSRNSYVCKIKQCIRNKLW